MTDPEIEPDTPEAEAEESAQYATWGGGTWSGALWAPTDEEGDS